MLFDGVISYLCDYSKSHDTKLEAVLENTSVEFKEIKIFLILKSFIFENFLNIRTFTELFESLNFVTSNKTLEYREYHSVKI